MEMGWQFSSYALLLGLVAAGCIWLAYLAWQRRSAPGGAPAVVVLLAGAVYAAGYALELTSTTLPAMNVWSKVQYVGIAALPSALLAFAFEYSGIIWVRKSRIVLALSVEPITTVLLRATNELHHLVYAGVTLDTSRVPIIQLIRPGPYYWLHMIYTNLCVFAAAILLVQMLWHSFRIYRAQVGVLLLGLAAPWAASIVYLLRWGPFPGLDLAPLGFSVTAACVAWNLLGLRWLDIVPLARETVMEAMSDGVLVLDAEDRLVYMNAALHRLLGDEMTYEDGEPLSNLQPAWSELVDVLRDWSRRPRLVTLVRGKEEWFFDPRLSSVNDWRGRPVCRIVVLRDVTEQTHAEGARQRLEEQMRQVEKMEAVGALAGGVAHEFNNLLTVILGRAELGLAAAELPPPVQEDLHAVQRAAGRAAELTRQLLAFGQRGMLRPRPVDLNLLVSDFSTAFGRALGDKVQVQLALQPGLAPLVADPDALEQVLMSLTLNARDAMPDGGVLRVGTAQVAVGDSYTQCEAEPDVAMQMGLLRAGEVASGEYVRLSVADTGVGMDESILHHLFEPFFTTKEVGVGTGLGLSTVYGIVVQHHGWIEVHSQPGQGTRFEIYLPAPKAA